MAKLNRIFISFNLVILVKFSTGIDICIDNNSCDIKSLFNQLSNCTLPNVVFPENNDNYTCAIPAGGNCNKTPQARKPKCTDRAVCLSGVCTCFPDSVTYLNQEGNRGCKPKKAHHFGQKCLDSTWCESGKFLECSNNICSCAQPSQHSFMMGQCRMNVGSGNCSVDGIEFPRCAVNAHCLIDLLTSETICKCQEGYIKDFGGCMKDNFNKTQPNNGSYIIENIWECMNLTNLIFNNETKSCLSLTDHLCDNSSNTTERICHDENAECVQTNGPDYYCKCKIGYHLENKNMTCFESSKLRNNGNSSFLNILNLYLCVLSFFYFV